MNNERDHSEIARNITNKIVEYVLDATIIQNCINSAKEDAIQTAVKFFARNVVRDECSCDGVDTDELARELGVRSTGFEEWEDGVTGKVSEKACEELRQRIKVPVISESTEAIPEHREKPKYQVLLG